MTEGWKKTRESKEIGYFEYSSKNGRTTVTVSKGGKYWGVSVHRRGQLIFHLIGNMQGDKATKQKAFKLARAWMLLNPKG